MHILYYKYKMRRISSCPCIVQSHASHASHASHKHVCKKSVSVCAFDVHIPDFFNTFVEEVQTEAILKIPAHTAHLCLLESATEFPTSILKVQQNGSSEQFNNLIKCLKDGSSDMGDSASSTNLDSNIRREVVQFLYDKSAFRSIKIRRRKSLWS